MAKNTAIDLGGAAGVASRRRSSDVEYSPDKPFSALPPNGLNALRDLTIRQDGSIAWVSNLAGRLLRAQLVASGVVTLSGRLTAEGANLVNAFRELKVQTGEE